MAATETDLPGMTHYEKISPTAKLVAYLRRFSDIPFAKDIAEESGAERTFRELAGGSSESLVRLAPFWEARYKVTDRIISQRGITQILEVAAGLSPRGLAMTQDSRVVYVVTDLPQILDEEKAIAETILSKSNSRRPNLHFEAADALDRESLSRASTVFGFDRPVAIITEGLLPYLNRKEKAVLAGNVYEVLGKYGGIWIASDVHTRQYLEEISRLEESVRQRLSSISSSTDRNLENNVFADENDLEVFFGEAGFNVEEYRHSSVVADLTSVRILNLTQQEIVRIQEILGMVKTLILIRRNT
jgi:O-methyltransferase involved in polyketide biosynthesis